MSVRSDRVIANRTVILGDDEQEKEKPGLSTEIRGVSTFGQPNPIPRKTAQMPNRTGRRPARNQITVSRRAHPSRPRRQKTGEKRSKTRTSSCSEMGRDRVGQSQASHVSIRMKGKMRGNLSTHPVTDECQKTEQRNADAEDLRQTPAWRHPLEACRMRRCSRDDPMTINALKRRNGSSNRNTATRQMNVARRSQPKT